MLPPDSRGVLLQHLRPDPGSTMDSAVATTFTLDLKAAVVPTLAFSAFGKDSSVADPISELQAVRAAASKIDIFHQVGSVAVPRTGHDLFAFVEPMVHAVRRPPGGLFHPKVWFVRYLDEERVPSYRLLVLTRNLTNDCTWDVVVRLDSNGISRRRVPENNELRRFLESLLGDLVAPLDPIRERRVRDLARLSNYVEWERPDGVDNVAFHFLPRRGHPDFSRRRHLVVSPFINAAGLDIVAPNSEQLTVVSRAETLDCLPTEQLGRPRSLVVDIPVLTALESVDESSGSHSRTDSSVGADSSAKSGSPLGLLTELHAKLYVVEPHGRAHRARLFIGSANATEAAFTRNIEFLVEFEGKRSALGIDTFVGNEGTLNPIVEEYLGAGGLEPDSSLAEQWEVKHRLRTLAEIPHQVEVQAERLDHGEAR